MENNSMLSRDDEQMELPPGFRFHPTDEELITHYLSQKVLNNCFCARAIGRAKMGEKEWYFFCVRDRKYPTGLRTNRATASGYWKATGKDKEIYRAKTLVGMKKTLVFYKGRALKERKPTGMNGLFAEFSKRALEERKLILQGCETWTSEDNTSHVTCFSKPMEDTKKPKKTCLIASTILLFSGFYVFFLPFLSSVFKNLSSKLLLFLSNFTSFANLQYPNSALMPEQSILKMMLENQGPNMKQDSKMEPSFSPDISSLVINPELVHRSFEDQKAPSSSAGPVGLDCLWSY
ncbi:hypothetical protein GH714_012348 [Hevea brasiliensis]|uniref:NAC domain-containing protein n=1 Tax=Hevea brasiliensis TaxID=3981 RepID=A0A6A6MIJ9_HEVBR|nr:hypothetical protein GH714_012348 [Hevea brasiliensis]